MTNIKNRDQFLKKKIDSELKKIDSENLDEALLKQIHSALKAAFDATPSDAEHLEKHVVEVLKEQLNPKLVEEHAIKAAQSAIDAFQKDFEKDVIPAYLERIQEDEADKKRLVEALEQSASALEQTSAEKAQLEDLVKTQGEQLSAAITILSSLKDGEIADQLNELSSKVEAVDAYQKKADKALGERLASDRKAAELVTELVQKLDANAESTEQKLAAHLETVDARVESIKGLVTSGIERAKVLMADLPSTIASATKESFGEFREDLQSLRKTGKSMVDLLKVFEGVYDNLKSSAEESTEAFTNKLESASSKVEKSADKTVETLGAARKKLDTTVSHAHSVQVEMSKVVADFEQVGMTIESKVTNVATTMHRATVTEIARFASDATARLNEMGQLADESVREYKSQMDLSANKLINDAKQNMAVINGLCDEMSGLSTEVRDMKAKFDPETADRVQEQLSEFSLKLEQLKDEDSYKEQIDELSKRYDQLLDMLESLMNPEKNNNNEG